MKPLRGKCPICGQVDTIYSSPITKLKTHLISAAKTELWQHAFDRKVKMPHLDWLKKHYRIRTVRYRNLPFDQLINKYIFTEK